MFVRSNNLLVFAIIQNLSAIKHSTYNSGTTPSKPSLPQTLPYKARQTIVLCNAHFCLLFLDPTYKSRKTGTKYSAQDTGVYLSLR